MIDLCTADDVKLKLETVTNDFDNSIGSLITDVSHRAQTVVLDRDLELQTYIEIHDGGCKRVYPRQVPVVSITEIRISLSLDFAGGSILPTNDYALVNGDWDIAHVSTFPARQNGVQITYISGYLDAVNPLNLIPKDLRGAIARQVAYEFKYRKFDGLSHADVADGALVLEDNMFLRAVMPILKKYRKTKLG
jgi:hypothetical protein